MTFEILDLQSTPLGILILRRRELVSRPGTIVTEVTLNHEFLMSSYLTESERALTRVGLELVQRHQLKQASKTGQLKVLVGGLGLGYTAAEALESKAVATVEVVEFLPQVIGWLEKGLIPLADTLQSSSRLSITAGDIYARVTNPTDQRFDLIAIDVDHSPHDVLGIQSHGFYTRSGLMAVQQQLNDGGVLAVWSYAKDTPLLEKMKSVFSETQAEQVTVWNDLIDVEQTDWLFFGVK